MKRQFISALGASIALAGGSFALAQASGSGGSNITGR